MRHEVAYVTVLIDETDKTKPVVPSAVAYWYSRCKRSLTLPLSWERGHLGRYFSGRDARAPRGE